MPFNVLMEEWIENFGSCDQEVVTLGQSGPEDLNYKIFELAITNQ